MLDLLVIGGGVNGVGVARDAAGRGLKVALAEAGDLAGATSSASSKLVHGGLRYLEFMAFAMVRKSLIEREIILRNAPHISHPLPFLLPLEPHLRPAWMIRSALFLYDHLARRREVPGTQTVALQSDAAGPAFQRRLTRAFRYFDGWIDDARLVVLNARDAADRGARILTRTAVVSARFADGHWQVALDSGETLQALKLVNCAGPWAGHVAGQVMGMADAPALSLVQGGHIVVRRINRTADAFTLQQEDGRIVFVLPFEGEFSLIGTTETSVDDPAARTLTADEERYLLDAVNRSIARPITAEDIVHRFAGVRPLVRQDGKTARETTRDWQLVRHEGGHGLTVVGGKLTTYRRLAEAVLAEMAPDTRPWTAGAPLPGGAVDRQKGETAAAAFQRWLAALKARFPDYDPKLIARMARLWGTDTEPMLTSGLGRNFGGLFEAELVHMRDREWAQTAEDVLWRRTRMGLTLPPDAQDAIRAWMGG